MSLDLFDEGGEIRDLGLPDADVLYLQRAPLPRPADLLLASLIEETNWRAENVVIWGRTLPQPRLIAWHGDSGRSYAYSGVRLEPMPWTPLLLELKTMTESIAQVSFNSVLLNYYRNERDSMGLHSDDEPELGPRPTIASLSLGAERVFVFKHRHKAAVQTVKVKLHSGSILIMKGGTQKNWKHGIPKESRPCGPRVNLTFRRIVTSS